MTAQPLPEEATVEALLCGVGSGSDARVARAFAVLRAPYPSPPSLRPSTDVTAFLTAGTGARTAPRPAGRRRRAVLVKAAAALVTVGVSTGDLAVANALPADPRRQRHPRATVAVT